MSLLALLRPKTCPCGQPFDGERAAREAGDDLMHITLDPARFCSGDCLIEANRRIAW